MPLIQSQRTANSCSLDGMDLLVRGMQLRSDCNSSPSLRELLSSKYSPSSNRRQGQDEVDEIPSHSGKSRCETDALSAFDLQQRRDNDDDDIEIKHILPFVKEAAPGIYGHYPVVEPEPLLEKKPGIHR